MKYLILLLTALMLGCPGSGPESRGIEVESNDVLPGQAEAEALAMDIVGDYPNTNIYWTNTVCPTDAAGRTAVIYDGICYAGLTFSCDEIYVARRDFMWQTALIHELGHCFRLNMGLYGDAEHEVSSWWEWMQAINAEVKANGW